jgi:hypothetical protein
MKLIGRLKARIAERDQSDVETLTKVLKFFKNLYPGTLSNVDRGSKLNDSFGSLALWGVNTMVAMIREEAKAIGDSKRCDQEGNSQQAGCDGK